MTMPKPADAANEAVKGEIDVLRAEVKRLTDVVADMAKAPHVAAEPRANRAHNASSCESEVLPPDRGCNETAIRVASP